MTGAVKIANLAAAKSLSGVKAWPVPGRAGNVQITQRKVAAAKLTNSSDTVGVIDDDLSVREALENLL